tara:strand:+ start:4995 stop:5441 length:447 start_codon:yes stop_codon:yes gene_type:complete
MANQSLVSVPPNVEDAVVLQRFLSHLVEQLDVVLGNRSGPNDQYASQQDLINSAEVLAELLRTAQDSLEQALLRLDDVDTLIIEELTNRIEAIEEKNIEQDNRLDNIDILNTEQDSRLTVLETAGYIVDAPSDGNVYGRKDGVWVIIV